MKNPHIHTKANFQRLFQYIQIFSQLNLRNQSVFINEFTISEMVRVKKSSGPQTPTAQKIMKILSTKRSVFKPTSDSSQSQPQIFDLTMDSDNENQADSTSQRRVLQTARKSTSTLMEHVKIQPVMSSDDDDDGDGNFVEEPRTVSYKTRDGSIKKRYAPGTRALKEIRYFQQTTGSCIPKAPFARLVREVTRSVNPIEYRYEIGALMALQVSFHLIILITFQAYL